MLRKLKEINSDLDVYQPVSIKEINFVQKEIGINFPAELIKIYQKPNLRELKRLPTFFWIVDHPSMGIIQANQKIRLNYMTPFPEYLKVFSTSECGDYWCINCTNNQVIFIDHERSIAENLVDEQTIFESITEWINYFKKTG